MQLDEYEQRLLDTWEEVYKKGLLTFWILLALKDGPKHMTEIKHFISKQTRHTVTVDDKSLYRSLRRVQAMDMIEHTSRPGKNGPDLKVYSLNSIGSKVLHAFAKRNIIDVFYQPTIQSLLERK